MKYEFHQEINRLNTASEKWDEVENLFQYCLSSLHALRRFKANR